QPPAVDVRVPAPSAPHPVYATAVSAAAKALSAYENGAAGRADVPARVEVPVRVDVRTWGLAEDDHGGVDGPPAHALDLIDLRAADGVEHPCSEDAVSPPH